MGRIIDYEDIAAIANAERKLGKTIVFTSGGFDCFHLGHLAHLEESKGIFDNVALFVAVSNDITLRKLKGSNRPFFDQKVRVETIANLDGVVDYVIPNQDQEYYAALTHRNIVELLRPDYWTTPEGHLYRLRKIIAERLNIGIITTRRTPPFRLTISSTNIICELTHDHSIALLPPRF